MADDKVDIDALLSAADAQFKSIEVKKEIDAQLDVGNLLLTDSDPVDVKEFKKNIEGYLKSLARDNTQLLFNEVWKLPTERFENVIVAQLPKGTTVLPREKPVPKPRAPTKWEEFAKKKGITKKKRERMIYDDVEKKWKPRHGYKRTNDDTKHWVAEVPDNADPYEDMFEKRLAAKKERVAKNEFQRLRNVAKRKGSTDLLPSAAPPNKQQMKNAINIARASTASLGKFQDRLPKEKISKKTGKKRKFEPVVGAFGTERSRSLELAAKIMKRTDPLDVNKAVNKHMASTERTPQKKKGEGGKKGKGKGPAKGGKKGVAGKGKKKGRK